MRAKPAPRPSSTANFSSHDDLLLPEKPPRQNVSVPTSPASKRPVNKLHVDPFPLLYRCLCAVDPPPCAYLVCSLRLHFFILRSCCLSHNPPPLLLLSFHPTRLLPPTPTPFRSFVFAFRSMPQGDFDLCDLSSVRRVFARPDHHGQR